MESLETKKLALIRIWQILKEHSDYKHPLTQAQIAQLLDREYGIHLERKAISRNISLLKEAGIEIEAHRSGCYLDRRDFEDAELHLLIDGILSSKYITARHSEEMIEKICSLSNRYFKSSVKHIRSVNEWNKTENQSLFYNIEMIDSAIEKGRRIRYDYNKYGADKKLHKSSSQTVSPYQMILHNQRYYLMAYSEYWGNMVFHRLDHITDMKLTDQSATPLRSIKGYENGINYKELSSALPYMYTDARESVTFLADVTIIDQIVDWFGTDVRFLKTDDENRIKVVVQASPNAMEHWAMQYMKFVEVVSPESLRTRIKETLDAGMKKYENTVR